MIVDQTIEARAMLARSPSFAMSLGAKELFHTNFLGFLLESEDEQLEDVRRALRDALGFPVLEGELSRCFVWREKRHLDLILVPIASGGDSEASDAPVRGRALVVEAKLKSVPTWEQLERYSKGTLESLRLDHDAELGSFRINLSTAVKRSAVKPDLVLLAPTDAEVHSDWANASWSATQEKLRAAASRLPSDSPFAPILGDYADALGALLQVVAATQRFVAYVSDAPGMTYGDYESELVHADLRRLRLHDLVGKLANDEWLRRLAGQLKGQVDPDLYRCVVPYVHFSKSHPGLGMEISAPGGFQLGVQIQGGQFRRYVSCATERSDLEQHVQRTGLWDEWFMQPVAGNMLTGLPRKAADAPVKLRCFNRKKFLYSAFDLQPVNWRDAEAAILESTRLALRKAADAELWV